MAVRACEPCGAVCVPESEAKLIEQCGGLSTVAHAGFVCFPPCLGYCVGGSLSLRLQQREVRCAAKTRDNVFVSLVLAVQYQVENDDVSIARAHYRLTNAHSQIDAYVVDSVRAAVPTIDLDEVFEAKGAIGERVRRSLAEAMEPFGYAVLSSPVTDVRIDDAGVRDAIARVHVAARMRLAAEDAAEVQKIRTVKAAESAATRTQIMARARGTAAFYQGQGAARRHRAILAGMEQDAASGDADGINAAAALRLMLVGQQAEAYAAVGEGARAPTVFVDPSPHALGDLVRQVAGMHVPRGVAVGGPAAPVVERMTDREVDTVNDFLDVPVRMRRGAAQ